MMRFARRWARFVGRGILLAGWAAIWGAGGVHGMESEDDLRRNQVREAVLTLTHADPVMRQRAAVTLYHLQDPSAADALLQALEDADLKVRGWAAKALGALGPAGQSGLIRGLANTSVAVRRTALGALTLLGAPALPLLVAALDDPDPFMRLQIAFQVLQLGEPLGLLRITHGTLEDADQRIALVQVLAAGRSWRTLGYLTHAAVDPDPGVREAAVKGLAGYGTSALVALTTALRDRSPKVREHALIGLKKLSDPRAVPSLERAASDSEVVNRRLAVEALAHLGPAAFPALQRLADRHTLAITRNAAREVLGTTIPATLSAAVDGALACLREDEPFTHTPAVMSLMNLSPFHPLVLTALGTALEDSDWGVRRLAVKAIGYRGRSALPWLSLAVRDPHPLIRQDAAQALAVLRDPAGLPVLAEMVTRADRGLALQALFKLEGYGRLALPALAQALTSVNGDVAQTAAGMLGRVPDEESVWMLFTAAGSVQAGVRLGAAHALGEMTHPRALPVLAVLATDPDPGVRHMAVRSLVRWGPAAGWALMDVLGDPQPDVRLWAIAGVGLFRLLPSVPSLVMVDAHPVMALSLYALPSPPASILAEIHQRATSAATPEARQQALWELNLFADGGSATRVAALRDVDEGVRHVALAGCRTSHALVLSGMAACMGRDQSLSIRQHAVMAAARLGGLESLSLLLQAAGDADPGIRLAALMALARFPPAPPLVTVMKRLTHDPDAFVQRAALQCLTLLEGPGADLLQERESPAE